MALGDYSTNLNSPDFPDYDDAEAIARRGRTPTTLTDTCHRCGRVETFQEPAPAAEETRMLEVMTYTETCARCGRAEEVRYTADSDHWSLGPDGWLVIMVDWDGFLASRPGDGFDLVVLHVCPSCVTEEDQDAPQMSWRLQSGAAMAMEAQPA